jgi:HAD superfamily hydrolase (TIGR01662 family)
MLFIFDLDRTLATMYGVDLLPGVRERLSHLVSRGHKLAIATNQAGPAWGLATGDPKYPTPESLTERFHKLAATLPETADVPWFVAVGDTRLTLSAADYDSVEQRMGNGRGSMDLHISADPCWRKPEPGMLLAACSQVGISLSEAVFVGDSKTDADAARAVGVAFVSAGEFFAPGAVLG